MTARWSYEDDRKLVACDGVSVKVLAQYDFPRTATAIRARYRKLRESGAYAVIEQIQALERDYRRCLGLPCAEDME